MHATNMTKADWAAVDKELGFPFGLGVEMKVEIPDLDSMPARWERYITEQDLTGFDRDRITRMGKEYLARAVEVAD